MLIRYLHVGRSLSAIEASSPFDKIFFDFQKSSLRTSGYNLFVKEYQPKTKGGFILYGLTYVHISVILYFQTSKIKLV